jgi:hypothetical protein
MYRSLIIELVQIAPFPTTRSAPCPILAFALAPARHRVALTSAGSASSRETTGKPQPQSFARTDP